MKARFLLSTLDQFPKFKDAKGNPLPQVVLAGKSNVGKSSLINHFFSQKNLAKTSNSPGKTRLLNFFLVEERFLFADLPGYGFAKASHKEIQNWSAAIEAFLETESIQLVLLLIDSRRGISSEDQKMIDFSKRRKIPFLLIFTKTDKLLAPEKDKLMKTYPEALLFSIKDRLCSKILQRKIEKILWG